MHFDFLKDALHKNAYRLHRHVNCFSCLSKIRALKSNLQVPAFEVAGVLIFAESFVTNL